MKSEVWDVDLRPLLSPVEHQAFLPTCTANSVIGAVEYLQRQKGDKRDYSRLFLNWCGKSLDGTQNDPNAGLPVMSCYRALELHGVCREAVWPYNKHRVTTMPKKKAFHTADKMLGIKYNRLPMNLNGMRGCLNRQFPFVIAFVRYLFQEISAAGDWSMPPANGTVTGSHAVLVVGYSDSARKVLVRNSWGVGWGTAGYGTLPYGYLEDSSLTDDWVALESIGKVVSPS